MSELFGKNSKAAQVIGDYILQRLRTEIKDQGHELTGSLSRSLEYVVEQRVQGLLLTFFGNDYGAPLNTGVTAARIPYTPGVARAPVSKYIQGLIRFVELRMNLRGKEAVSVAFAIARTHKREGMPTRGSYRFSQNGRRTRWVDSVIDDDRATIEAFISNEVANEFEVLITNFVAQTVQP